MITIGSTRFVKPISPPVNRTRWVVPGWLAATLWNCWSILRADEPHHASLHMRLSQARKHWRLLLLGLVLAGGGSVLFRPEAPFTPIRASAEFLPAGSRIPAYPASWFERWVPMSWAWLWRLHDRIRGPLASILIDAKIIDCTGLSELVMAGVLPEPALTETNGLRGWILDGPTLAALERQLEQAGGQVLTSPRVQTAHGIHSSMSVGNTVPVPGGSVQVGLVLELFPLLQPDGTELMSILALTEAITNRVPSLASPQGTAQLPGAVQRSVVTNLAAAARWTLPDGTGFFMLGTGASDDSRRIGAVVSVTVKRPRK